MIDYTEIIKYIKPITTEISILKSVVESSVTNNNTVDPLVVFFQDDDNKSAIALQVSLMRISSVLF